jgi:hypothetical protein
MAGITVAMLAESCEKNSVAFLYIYILKCVSSVCIWNETDIPRGCLQDH